MPLISPGAGGPSSARACGAFAFGLASSAERRLRARRGHDGHGAALVSLWAARGGSGQGSDARVPVEGPGAVRPSDHALGRAGATTTTVPTVSSHRRRLDAGGCWRYPIVYPSHKATSESQWFAGVEPHPPSSCGPPARHTSASHILIAQPLTLFKNTRKALSLLLCLPTVLWLLNSHAPLPTYHGQISSNIVALRFAKNTLPCTPALGSRLFPPSPNAIKGKDYCRREELFV